MSYIYQYVSLDFILVTTCHCSVCRAMFQFCTDGLLYLIIVSPTVMSSGKVSTGYSYVS